METIGPATRPFLSGPLPRAILTPLRQLLWTGEEPRPRSRRRAALYLRPLGLLVVALVGLGAWAEAGKQAELSTAVEVLIAAGSVLPLALCLRLPVLAWRVAYPMLAVGVLVVGRDEYWPWNVWQTLVYLVVIARVAITQESGVKAWATALSLIPLLAFAPSGDKVVVWTVVLVAIAALGDIVYRRRHTRKLLAEQEEISERERARRALLEERARIAREMHDVVAHHMSMIAVRAETAPYRVPGLADDAQSELATIATAARAALTDMRLLLGTLRAEDGETPTAPQPGLADVDELVRTARAAGVDVSLAMHGVLDVPETVGLAAYRILQEALANAARHAPGAPVRVEGRGFPDRLELTVRNTRTGPGGPGGGHGLIGMRERAVLLGGKLTVGPDRSDFVVSATLPLGQEENPG